MVDEVEIGVEVGVGKKGHGDGGGDEDGHVYGMALKRLNLRPSPSLLPRLRWKPSQSESMTLPRACLRRLHLHLRRRIHLRLHLQCDPCPLRLDSSRSIVRIHQLGSRVVVVVVVISTRLGFPFCRYTLSPLTVSIS